MMALLIRNLVEGEFNNPIRIVAFNSAGGWCRDATVDIADELRRRYTEFGEVPESSSCRRTGAEIVGPPVH
jgi:hypothetical protein